MSQLDNDPDRDGALTQRNEIEKNLAGTGWLAALPASVRTSVLQVARWREFGSGETVYAAGSDGSTIWGIGAGAVKMYISVGEERMRFCHVVGAGYWFGELELLLELPRLIEMRASGATRLLCLYKHDLEKIEAGQCEIWLAVARLAATNEALAVAGVDDLMLRDPRKRLAATLLRLSGLRWDFQGRRPLNPIPVTLVELAEAAGLSRSIAAKLMAEFAKGGIVEKGYKSINIKNAEKLVDIVQ